MNLDRLSSINISRVLKTIYKHGTINRPTLSSILGLDRSTIAKIIAFLVERNLVTIGAKGSSTSKGGRRPSFVSLNYQIGHVIGIELQTDRWYAVGIDLKGETIFALSNSVSRDKVDVLSVLEEIAQKVSLVSNSQDLPLLATVVAMPGLISPYSATIIQSNPLNVYHATAIEKAITPYLKAPVLAENDANACSWGELFRQGDNSARDFATVLVELRRVRLGEGPNRGIGVGLGIVLNHHVHHGVNYSAGEFQSIFRKPPTSSQFDLPDAEALHIIEDEELLTQIFTELSANLALIVNTMNLNEVVIVGDLAQYRNKFNTILAESINNNWSYDTPATCSVRFTDLGRETVAFGAACMFIERLYSVPMQSQTNDIYPMGIELFDLVAPHKPTSVPI